MSSAVARPMRSSSKKLTSSTSGSFSPIVVKTLFSKHCCQKRWLSPPVRSWCARREGGREDHPRAGRRPAEPLLHDVIYRRRLVTGEVDAEVGGRPLQIFVVGIPHLNRRPVTGEHLDIETQRLQLFEQHLERLGNSRLRNVITLDDGLVH